MHRTNRQDLHGCQGFGSDPFPVRRVGTATDGLSGASMDGHSDVRKTGKSRALLRATSSDRERYLRSSNVRRKVGKQTHRSPILPKNRNEQANRRSTGAFLALGEVRSAFLSFEGIASIRFTSKKRSCTTSRSNRDASFRGRAKNPSNRMNRSLPLVRWDPIRTHPGITTDLHRTSGSVVVPTSVRSLPYP